MAKRGMRGLRKNSNEKRKHLGSSINQKCRKGPQIILRLFANKPALQKILEL